MPRISVNPSVALDEFVSQMMREKGAITDNEQQNTELANQLKSQLDEVIDRAIIDALPEDKLPVLDDLLNRDASDTEIENFFVNAGADFEQAVQTAMEKFRAEYLDGAASSTMTNTNNNGAAATRPAGSPMQGTSSEVPGASDVEGVAEQTTVTAEEEM